MKKLLITLFICLLFIPCLYAEEGGDDPALIEFVSDEDLLEKQKKPFGIDDRFFELGLMKTEVVVSNNYLTIGEIFSKTLLLNIDNLRDGLQVSVGADVTPLYFNFNSHKGWGFGMSVLKLDAAGIFGLSGKILSLSEARDEKTEFSGALYASTEISGFFQIQKFKVKVKPALYYTMAYIRPNIKYTFENTSEGDRFFIDYEVFVHTAFPMENFPNQFSLTGTPGFDFSVGVEYPLSKELGLNEIIPFLDFDVGLDFINIPIVSSTTKDYMRLRGTIGSRDPFYIIDQDKEGSGEGDGGLGGVFKHNPEKTIYDESVMRIERPFKMLVSANWRPLLGSRLLTITPVLGFSLSPIYLQPVGFEGGVNATVNIVNMFIVTAGINYFDRVWINSLDFGLNFRAVQLDIGVDMRSQDFIKSWTAGGAGVRIGLRFGW